MSALAPGSLLEEYRPVGHNEPLDTYLDEHLLDHDVVWAAAGTPRAVFPIDPRELVQVTSATVVAVATVR